jgi:ketosteroid isomerase-like protein
MHHPIVRRRSHRLYAALSAGDPVPMLDAFGKRFAYTFVGQDHPLSGTRRTRDHMSAQLDRVLRLFPGIRFQVADVLVTGPLWDTRVAVVGSIHAALPDGSAYHNDLVQLLRLRWGRVVRVWTFVDTHRLTDAFDRLKSCGVAEAGAPPVS